MIFEKIIEIEKYYDWESIFRGSLKYKNVKTTKCKVTDLKAQTQYKFKIAALIVEDGKYVVQTKSRAYSAITKASKSIIDENSKKFISDAAEYIQNYFSSSASINIVGDIKKVNGYTTNVYYGKSKTSGSYSGYLVTISRSEWDGKKKSSLCFICTKHPSLFANSNMLESDYYVWSGINEIESGSSGYKVLSAIKSKYNNDAYAIDVDLDYINKKINE